MAGYEGANCLIKNLLEIASPHMKNLLEILSGSRAYLV